MSYGEHSHYAEHITRVIQRKLPHPVGARPPVAEILQFICKADGIIFKEIPITKES